MMRSRFNRFWKLGFFLLLAFLLAAVSQGWLRSLAASTGDVQAWQDEFRRKEARWDWSYMQGDGFRTLVTTSSVPTALKIGVTAQASNLAYSDSSLHEGSTQYTGGILEMRLRANNHQEARGAGQGTRGWGFWDGNYVDGSAAWFWSASSESDPRVQGFHSQVYNAGVLLHNQKLDIDIHRWHIYRVEMSPSGVIFKVDGVIVAESEAAPLAPMRPEIWVDNFDITLTEVGAERSFIDIQADQYLLIDWVRYTPLNNP